MPSKTNRNQFIYFPEADSGEQKSAEAEDSAEKADADDSQSSETEATPTTAEESNEDTDAADSKEADADDSKEGDKSEEKPDDDQSSENDEVAIKKREISESHEITTKSYPVDDLLLVNERVLKCFFLMKFRFRFCFY